MAADARDEALASERGSSHTCDILLPGENVFFFWAHWFKNSFAGAAGEQRIRSRVSPG